MSTSTYPDRDIGNGILHTFNREGDISTCHTINGYCAGCGEPLISEGNRHDGPSESGAFDFVSQDEKDRIERVTFDMGGGWDAFDSRHGGLRRGG